MGVVVLGIDGLDRRTVARFESALSTVVTLRERGVCAPLESTHPATTASAWPSLYTGTGPSHHGVFGTTRADGYPDEPRPVSRVDVRRPALWDYLSSEGRSSIVLNVPLTHPADPINGVVVPGAPAPEDERGHPDGIRDELRDAIGERYRISRRAPLGPPAPASGGHVSEPDESDEIRDRVLALVDQRREAVRVLLEREEWELAICRVIGIDAFVDDERERLRTGTGTEAGTHDVLPPEGVGSDDDDRRALYAAADSVVETVLETVDDETAVVVCSTRGVAPVIGYRLTLNDFLRECGYVETTEVNDRSSGRPDRTNGTPALEAGTAGETERGSSTRSFERTRRAVSGVVQRLGLESVLDRVNARSTRAPTEIIDWRESLAYCVAGERMGVRINLAGREPHGTVSPSNYETVRDDLVGLLSALETPAGEPAFEFVCRCERLHDGPFLEDAPDVLVRPNRSNHTVSADLRGRPFQTVATVGSTPKGLFVGAGPGFDGGSPDPYHLSLPDVGAIVMGALGRPVPSLMTGRVPENVLCEQPDEGEYLNVAMGATTTDPTFDDGDIPDCVDGVNSHSWER